MLHELLFVLSGYPGDVFVPYPSPDQPKTFVIKTDFPLLHTTERDALNRLGQLGWIYSRLCTFIDITLHPRRSSSGIYHRAYATCLSTVLSDYRSLLLDMETRMVTKQDQAGKGVVPLSLITSTLGRWELVLPGLLRLTDKIRNQEEKRSSSSNSGAGDADSHILDILMDQARTGLPELHDAVVYMILQLHNVFYRQLTAWMIYGQLPTQPCLDFFIAAKKEPAARTTTLEGEGTEEEEEEEEEETTAWQRYYELIPERLPKHISLATSESVFYVGKAVSTIQSKQRGLVMPAAMKKRHISLLRSLHSTQCTPSINTNSESAVSSPTLSSTYSISSSDETMSPTLLSPLGDEYEAEDGYEKKENEKGSLLWNQQQRQLEKVVHLIRHSTTSWLFSQVFQREHDLACYFASFRQLFLLGDGELAIKWLENLDAKAVTTIMVGKSNPGQSSEGYGKRRRSSVHDIWQQQKREWHALLVKASVGTDCEGELDGYTFDMVPLEEQTSTLRFSALLNKRTDSSYGRLTYTLKWPIDLFLGDKDIQRYSKLWSFLIGLKKVQLSLQHVFIPSSTTPASNFVNGNGHASEDARQEEEEEEDEDEWERSLWRLRSLMLFWIDTLWSHVQGSVISRHHERLMQVCLNSSVQPASPSPSSTTKLTNGYKNNNNNNINDNINSDKPTIDFDQIQQAHEHYLTELTRGCLLSSTLCSQTMYSMLRICLDFCEFVQRREEGPMKKKRKKKRQSMSAADIVNNWSQQLSSSVTNRSSKQIAWIEQLASYEKSFVTNSEKLFGILSNQQQDMKSSGYLNELLMRLDYNKWYSGQRYKEIPDLFE